MAIWGTFDVANFGDLLFPRIFEHEVRRRLPDAVVQAYSPRGHLHPVPMAGGLRVEPLGHPTAKRLSELADALDLVAIGGGDIIHPRDDLYALWYSMPAAEARPLRPSAFFVDGLGARLEARAPVAWHAVGVPFDLGGEFGERVRRACSRRPYVSVRDERSRSRLYDAGVDREVALVPDSAFVLDRVFPRSSLDARHARLVAEGAYPSDAAPLVVQGGASLRDHVDEVGRALRAILADEPGLPVVLLETGPCHRDEEFADALSRYLDPTRRYRLSPGFVVDDLVAAIAHSRGFVGSSMHGCITAHVFGRPFVVLDLLGQSKLSSLVDITGTDGLVSVPGDLALALRALLGTELRREGNAHLRNRVDAHFDILAALSAPSRAERSPGAWRDARRGRRLDRLNTLLRRRPV